MIDCTSPAEGFSTMRAQAREAIEIDARCRVNGCTVPIKLKDFSSHGCRIVHSIGGMLAGRSLSVRINGLEGLPAEVCWSKEGSAGVRFYRPLYQPVVEHIQRMNRTRQGRPQSRNGAVLRAC